MSGEFLPSEQWKSAGRGLETADFVYVCGDAYVDHSSFGGGDHAAVSCKAGKLFGGNDSKLSRPDWKGPTASRCLVNRVAGLSEIGRKYGFPWLITIQCLKNTGRKMPILPVERWDIDRTGR
ncbi:MAG: hypothetical protein ACLVAT_02610 [Lachnospiraceae bacterium]